MAATPRRPWTEDELYHLWLHVHRQPAWLSGLCVGLDLDAQEEQYLTDLDDEWLTSAKVLERHWRTEMAEKAMELRREAVEGRPQPRGHRLTEEQVRHARSRPLESVLQDIPSKGFITCPLHWERTGRQDTHPSMLVKGGFGYCFSCGGSLDSIGYLMKVRGMTFRQAVEALQ